MNDEVVWKEHEIHRQMAEAATDLPDEKDNDDEDDNEPFIFDFFAKNEEDAYEYVDFDIPRLPHQQQTSPKLRIRGQFECTNSTGLGMWKGADVLAEFLIQNRDLIQNKRVLELGAGVGLCGLVAARLGASHVIMTDGDTSVLSNMRYNIQQNMIHPEDEPTESTENNNDNDQKEEKEEDNCHSKAVSRGGNVACHQLIWGRDLEDFVHEYGQQQVILATDCVYMTTSLQPLWQTVDALLDKGDGIFLFANYCASQAPLEKILDVATDHGFTWTHNEEDPERDVYIFRHKMSGNTTRS